MSIFTGSSTAVVNPVQGEKCKMYEVKGHPLRETFVTSLIQKHLVPLYGDLSDSVRRMFTLNDRKIYVLCSARGSPVGFVMFVVRLPQKDILIRRIFVMPNPGSGYERTLLVFVKAFAKGFFEVVPRIFISLNDKQDEVVKAVQAIGGKSIKSVVYSEYLIE